MSVSVGPSAITTGPRQFHGRWWVAGEPDVKAGGILSVPPGGDSSELRLLGGFPLKERGELTIVGDTIECGPVTISKAILRNRTTRRGAPLSETYLALGVLLGGALPSGSDSTFTRASLETRLLTPWTAEPRPEYREDGRLLSIEVTDPEALTCSIPGLGDIALWWPRSENWGATNFAANYHAEFVLEAPDGKTPDETWQEFVSPMLFFTTLLTGQVDSVARVVYMFPPGETDLSRVEEIPPGWATDVAAGTGYEGDGAIDFGVFSDRFGEMLTSWFEHYQLAESALIAFFSSMLKPSAYIEEDFSRVVRALEVWHRAVRGGTYLPESEFESVMSKVKATFHGREKEFLVMRLKFGNERTLRQRLESVLETAGPTVQTFLAEFPDFAQQVVQTRNALAHRAEIGEAFDHRGLSYAKDLLWLAMRANLLRTVGLSEAEVERAVRSSREWQWLRSAENPLGR
ncbi:hypothetical protein Q6346_07670 [Isoptericola sp. b490]|uniref:HEPN domain-containing protein n=1 Tax=Actinotalea lenta TaxID=3064654 RepID=UPI002712C147|nr:HEPN domain-containing protein [Isoptericola sp. b490]MDO8121189.1 hypothetical protein [Isoptericola sp. b490]